MNKVITTKSAEETKKIAKAFAATVAGGDVLLLFGNLGAGKTTFMQGLAEGLGVMQRIISPTFIIMRSYETEGKVKKLYHLDLYRITSGKDLEGLGLEEIFQEKDAVVAIEWPEKLGAMKPEKRIEICFTPTSEEERKIEIIKYD